MSTPLTDEQLQAIKEREAKATPGPWRWFGNADVHTVYLATAHFGRLTVMSFRRWGLQNAQPMFATDRTWKPNPQSGDDFGACGRMEMAARLVRYEVAPDAPDRTHPDVYRADLNGIKNPDAEFIAAARQDVPALLAEVERLRTQLAAVEKFCAARAEYITAINNCPAENSHDYWRWQGHAEGRRQLSQELDLPVAWPIEYKRTEQVTP